VSNTISTVNQPVSDVIQFFTQAGTKVTVRPSGTEPKIKFYFGVKVPIEGSVKNSTDKALQQIEAIKKEMNLV
jgi:phosphoglucomutase